MSSDVPATLRAESIAWRIRLSDAEAHDWADFTEWLECDPRRSPAYDAVAFDDEALDSTLADWARSMAATTNDNQPISVRSDWTRRRVGGRIGIAAVAAAVGLFLMTPQPLPATDFYMIATAPGEQRMVRLAGRDRVALNGATRIKLNRLNPRFASLMTGEAAFDIDHDVKHPFVVELGADRVLDVGTSFNIVRSQEGHKVEVSEGSVIYNPTGERIALAAGQTLTAKTKERRIILGRAPPSQVGGWQRGRLSYRSAPLAIVIADVARSMGTPIMVQSAIAQRTFTGTIEIDRNESRMLARLEPLLDVAAERDAHGWVLRRADGGPR